MRFRVKRQKRIRNIGERLAQLFFKQRYEFTGEQIHISCDCFVEDFRKIWITSKQVVQMDRKVFVLDGQLALCDVHGFLAIITLARIELDVRFERNII